MTRCGLFLASTWLSRETCLSVRALPGLTGEARALVDRFMAENVRFFQINIFNKIKLFLLLIILLIFSVFISVQGQPIIHFAARTS